MMKSMQGLWGVVILFAAWGCTAVVATPSNDNPPNGIGGGGGSGVGGAGSTASTGTSGAGGGPCGSPICPPFPPSACFALVDNSVANQFTLRMADLHITAPPALTKGLTNGVFQNNMAMNLESCGLHGGGTFSWLLQFDTATGTLKSGGAKPAVDPAQGYSFIDETIVHDGTSFKIAPFTADAPIQGGAFATTLGHDVILPVYLDIMAVSVVLLPLHDVKLTGKVSTDHGCIGKSNAMVGGPGGGCVPGEGSPWFIGSDGKADSDGAIDAHFTLEEADTVMIDELGQSLCAVLSGDSATYGDGGFPFVKCKRDAAMKIVLQGDWCDATNDASCADSVRFSAGFSASAVKGN